MTNNEQFQTREQLFDSDWRFKKADISDAELSDFDDSEWRIVNLPHDWSIEDLPNQSEDSIVGPFSKASEGNIHTGFTIGGVGWYRKYFKTSSTDNGKEISVLFDGVYMESEVWINGHYLGFHPNGYTAFAYKLSPWLNPAGEENVLAVKAKNIDQNSRWYSGSGIYRHVKLIKTNLLHIPLWGSFINSTNVSETAATVHVNSTISNQYPIEKNTNFEFIILDKTKKQVGFYSGEEMSISAGENKEFNACIQIANPQLWSTDSPKLYTAIIKVLINDTIVDQTTTNFGIRSIDFSAEKGFLLNGKPTLIKGGCMHHDNGILGSAAIDRAEERRVELMKKNGFNAIRTSHNPPSKSFLNACDHLGILVMDEAFDRWKEPKKDNDYHRYFKDWWKRDLTSMIKRDRNHPSVIIWSVGNEIPERGTEAGYKIRKKLVDTVKSIDTTRPVSEGICNFWKEPLLPWDATIPAFEALDVAGYNYELEKYIEDHKTFPNRVIVGTESFPYQALENWEMAKEHPWVIGDFVWTNMDYIGEAAIGNSFTEGTEKGWPMFNANCGDIDLCGFKKPQSYYRDVVWGRSHLEMFVHAPIPDGEKEIVSRWGWPDVQKRWNWPVSVGQKMEVICYTDCPTVQLELNGKTIATKTVSKDMKLKVGFEVPYEPGELRAIGIENNKEVTSQSLTSTGTAHQIKLTADRNTINSDGVDLSFISIEILDVKGQLVTSQDIQIDFTVEGEGEIAASGNANPSEVQSFRQSKSKTFRGKCLLILRSGKEKGNIHLVASTKGLKTGELTITTN